MNANGDLVSIFPFFGMIEVRRRLVRKDGRLTVEETTEIKTSALPAIKRQPQQPASACVVMPGEHTNAREQRSELIANGKLKAHEQRGEHFSAVAAPLPSAVQEAMRVKVVPMAPGQADELMKRASELLQRAKKSEAEDVELIKRKEALLEEFGATDLHIKLNGWKRHVYTLTDNDELITLNEVNDSHKLDWYVRIGDKGSVYHKLTRDQIMNCAFDNEGDRRIGYE